MSETKWTQGPWVVDERGTAHQPSVMAKLSHVASVGNAQPWCEAKPQWLANAQLIAAAPDLYAALEPYVNNCDNDECEYCIRARAALAKARGEET